MAKYINSRFRVGFTLVLLDGIFLIGIFCIFAIIRRGDELPLGNSFPLLSIPLILTLLSFYIISGYSIKTDLISLNYALEHFLSCLAAALFTVIFIYSFSLTPAQQFSRMVLPSSFITFSILSLFYRRFFYQKASNHFGQRYFLILGAGKLAQDFFLDCKKSAIKHDFHAIDLSRVNTGKPLCGDAGPIIENDLTKELELFGDKIDAIIIAEDRRGLKKEVLEKLIYCHLKDTTVYSIEEFYETYFHKIPCGVIQPHILLRGGFQLTRDQDFEKFKRLTDLTISLLGLAVCLPLFIVISILIRLDDKGPAIFKQKRVGKNNRSFKVIKFRTMDNSSGQTGNPYTLPGDPRITRIGKWLRLLRIDELPQLINVIKGEMSLIGPRAEWVKLTQIYEKEIPFYDIRHLVKPGITGWAQVNYPYGECLQDTKNKFEYDLYYIRNYSLKMDSAIILKTIYTVLFGRGQ